jgi:hypothetical protein
MMTITKFRNIAALLLMLFALVAVVAQKPQQPPPDYFPLRVGDWWKYRSTTADGKQSEFTIKVLSDEKQGDGTNLYLVETLTTFQPINDR